jgi:hypothetical protein
MSLKTYKKIRPAKVVVTMASGQVIEGTINIGFEQRVSDFLASPDKPFIPVFDINESRDVILINKTQIASVQPTAENLEPPDPESYPDGLSLEDRTGDVSDKGVPVL